jgi:hypothetical protein
LKLRTVINIARACVRLFAAAVIVAVVAAPGTARAAEEGNYFTTRSVLGAFFPKSDRVTYETVTLTSPVKERIARRLGYSPAAGCYTIFIATTAGNVDGYAVIDSELGEHQPITFATKLSPQAVVEQVEIVTYREPRGDEVRDARFRRQFVGKTGRDPLRLNRDIDAVSGATISSGAMAVGVRRAAVLVDEIMVGRTELATVGERSGVSHSNATR